MTKLEVMNRVRVMKTTDSDLDGKLATIMGFYGPDAIVLFDNKPQKHNPAIVLTIHCLERI